MAWKTRRVRRRERGIKLELFTKRKTDKNNFNECRQIPINRENVKIYSILWRVNIQTN